MTTTTASSFRGISAVDVLSRRAAALLAVASAALHAASFGEHTMSPVIALATVVMMIGCLYCARHLWVRGAVRDWGLVALMNVGMIALHLAMMGPSPGGSSHRHMHGDAASSVTVADSTSWFMTSALVVAAVEVALATSVLFYRTRTRSLPF